MPSLVVLWFLHPVPSYCDVDVGGSAAAKSEKGLAFEEVHEQQKRDRDVADRTGEPLA